MASRQTDDLRCMHHRCSEDGGDGRAEAVMVMGLGGGSVVLSWWMEVD